MPTLSFNFKEVDGAFRPKMESQVSLAQIGRQNKNDRFNRIEIKLHLITLQLHEFTSTTMHYKNIYKAQSFTYKQGNVPTWHKNISTGQSKWIRMIWTMY